MTVQISTNLQLQVGLDRIFAKRIAVMSGKGGVGKSLVAGLLAIGLARKGLKTTLMDADVLGPNDATLFGVSENAQVENDKILPARITENLDLVSSAMFLPDRSKAIIWRGPMVSKFLRELVLKTNWRNRDALVIDMPPGTGDVALTVLQEFRPTHIVIVGTPQRIVVEDVIRAGNMVKSLGYSVSAYVENFSYVDCGQRYEAFGKSKLHEVSKELGAKRSLALPLKKEVSELADSGRILDIADIDPFGKVGDLIE